MTKIGVSTSKPTFITTLKNVETRTKNANNSIQMTANEEQRTSDEFLKKILDEFVIPFRSGNYAGIDPNRKFDEYLEVLNKTKNDNICHMLGIESMAASLNSRFLYVQKTVIISENNKLKDEMAELDKKLREMEYHLRMSDENVSKEHFMLNICAKVEVESFDILPFIASRNVIIGWYFFLNGYNPDIGIDPEKYLQAKNIALTYGIEKEGNNPYSPAFYALLKLIKEQE